MKFRQKIKAPGKVFLCGEFGVLQGGRATIMAVDRYVFIEESPENNEASGEEKAHHEDNRKKPAALSADPLLEILLDEISGIEDTTSLPAINDDAFYSDRGNKLGLGSSAAKVAALTASAYSMKGEDIGSEDIRRQIFEVAWRAHRKAGGGSGADIACSVFGGTISFRLTSGIKSIISGIFEQNPSFEVSKINLPEKFIPIIASGGAPVSTRQALKELSYFLVEKSPAHIRAMNDAFKAGNSMSSALLSGKDEYLIETVKEASAALKKISSLLDIDPGVQMLESAEKIAASWGGAVKPSGAGIGDLILVFIPSVPARKRGLLISDLEKNGIDVLNLLRDRSGVSVYS